MARLHHTFYSKSTCSFFHFSFIRLFLHSQKGLLYIKKHELHNYTEINMIFKVKFLEYFYKLLSIEFINNQMSDGFLQLKTCYIK